MSEKINVGIVGGAGYTGGEAIRILLNHPQVNLAWVHSRSQAGKPLYGVHKDLLGDTELCFSGEEPGKADVIFLCLGHGESVKFLAKNNVAVGTKIIDLSQDFRLGKKDAFVYGLPEINREEISSAAHVANPGCFATAITLGLLPLASAGHLNKIYTTGITGSTGAGQSLSDTSHFSWREGNIQAYKTLQHQHLGEINQSLSQLQPSKSINLSFVPWRGNFTRGIFCSSQIETAMSFEEASELFQNFYTTHPFVTVSAAPISMKQVVNTNKAVIQLEKINDTLVVHSAIDNLLKGASGQAVQNMNLMFGLDETSGLRFKAAAF
ncbi:MAG: N-acetyl-gamma-glutamyl-phosphate reductase [Ferruginibacter sp.]